HRRAGAGCPPAPRGATGRHGGLAVRLTAQPRPATREPRPRRKELLVSTDPYVPARDDRFSFGIWTVGWQGVDVFGGAVRPPMPAERAVRKLAELGAYGVNFHDNDVFEFGASEAGRSERIAAFRSALDETGLVVTTATTNLFSHPMFRDGGFTANDRDVRRFALAKVMR